MALDKTHHYSTRTLDGPNWKVVIDGYLEGYHFASLHRTTVYRTNFSNMAAFDKWGTAPAQLLRAAPDRQRGRADRGRVGPGAVRRRDLLAVPRAWRSPAGGGRRSSPRWCCPARRWDTSHTQQILCLRHEPADDDERKAVEHTRDWFHDVVMDEDYATGYGVQRGLESFRDEDFVFGRNEPGVQHFHRILKEMTQS